MLRQEDLAVDVELLEDLMVRAEAPVSGAPLHTPPAAWLLILSPKEPNEPKKSHRR
ncbi:hypothetical protein ACTWP5_10865 [Streptomyces sp. 4N509B]|uniref:hypothetical protein n=1 Tax=Streptomyces sp. 4N509B TaxID=3457413 RepID=UPI003FD1D723